MKKIFFIATFIFSFSFIFPILSFAQSNDNHTAIEEAEGRVLFEKLQSKELICKNLSDENFESLGEYFMGNVAKEQHETMNNMMIQMMGEQSEEQIKKTSDDIRNILKIVNKTPTAELAPGQTDEEELGATYKEIDKLLTKIENRQELPKSELAAKILKRIKNNEHKRNVPFLVKL